MNQQTTMTRVARQMMVTTVLPTVAPTAMATTKLTSAKQVAMMREGMG